MITQNDLTKLEDKLRTEIRTSETNIRTDLTNKIEVTNEETRRFMGVLHEETLHKLDLVLEGFQPFTEKVGNHGRRIEKLENRVDVIEILVKAK